MQHRTHSHTSSVSFRSLRRAACSAQGWSASHPWQGWYLHWYCAGHDGPITGAMVTYRFGIPFQERTVFTDTLGRYRLGGVPDDAQFLVRVRRIGWADVRQQQAAADPMSPKSIS